MKEKRSTLTQLTRAILLLIAVFAMYPSATTYAAPQVIGGAEVEGELRITVEDDGSILVEQFLASVWVPHISPGLNANGSVLRTDLGVCLLGFNPSRAFSNLATPVSNETSLTGDLITTVIECDTAGVDWKQEVLTFPGSLHFLVFWTMTKQVGSAVTEGTFTHIQQTNVDGAGSSSGFGSSLISLVGASNIGSSETRGVALQAFFSPIAKYSGNKGSLLTSIPSGSALTEFIDTGMSDNAIAFRWDNPNLASEDTWFLGASEHIFTTQTADNNYMVAPIPSFLNPGIPATLVYLLVNNDSFPKTIDLSTSATGAGWTSEIDPLFSSVTVGAQASTEVFVEVTAPETAVEGEKSDVALTALSNGQAATAVTTMNVVESVPPVDEPPEREAIAPTITYPFSSTGIRTPTITGQSFPDALITLFIDGVPFASVFADSDGVWIISIDVPLAFGQHSLTVSSTDFLGRITETSAPFFLFVTAGAELDFEGDGFSDLTSYTKLGSAVIFRNKPSFNSASKIVAVKGAVPAPADYDGDTATDYAAIRRSGKNFIWSMDLSSTTQLTEVTFGSRGDTLLSGCHFASKQKYSLAALRGNDLFFTELGASAVQQVAGIINKSQNVIGCSDEDGDGIDELIVSSGTEEQDIQAIALSTEAKSLGTIAKFQRSVIVRQPNDKQAYLLSIRSDGAAQKVLEGIDLDDPSTSARISIPRRLIVGSGSFRNASNVPELGLIYQDLKTNKIVRFLDELEGTPTIIGTLARGARLVLPQYIYPTK